MGLVYHSNVNINVHVAPNGARTGKKLLIFSPVHYFFSAPLLIHCSTFYPTIIFRRGAVGRHPRTIKHFPSIKQGCRPIFCGGKSPLKKGKPSVVLPMPTAWQWLIYAQRGLWGSGIANTHSHGALSLKA